MLNSGHAVKHNMGQVDYPSFNIPPTVHAMVPKEKIVEKKYYLPKKTGKVHVITNTVVSMQEAMLGQALSSLRKIRKEDDKTVKFRRGKNNEITKEVGFTDQED